MPITQDRMISVINAARDYMQALQEAIKIIDSEREESPANESVRLLHQLISETALLRFPVDSRLAIERETDHFRRVSRYNQRMRLKQAKKRGLKPELKLRPNAFLPHRSMTRPAADEFVFIRSTAPSQPPMANPNQLFGSVNQLADQAIAKQLDPTLVDEPFDIGAEPENIDLNPIADDGSIDAEVARAQRVIDERARKDKEQSGS
jgi:hypothetical protein